MIRVEVVNTFLVNIGKSFVILLRSPDDDRTLPISIGQLEAQSIAFQLNQIPFPRPLTHDLFKNVLGELNGKVIRTEICDLKDDTFFARLVLEASGKELVIDSRPSDAIAMALRFSAPIFVEESVMEEAGILIPDAELQKNEFGENGAELNNSPQEATTADLLRKQLEVAIEEERYEDAARLRDEIKKLTTSN
jgi:bifunctional DNase/RNase